MSNPPGLKMMNKLVKPDSLVRSVCYGVLSGMVLFFLNISPAKAATVYELFTARDCPSCPRADELFLKIARNHPDIIALACHVTYFDRPGRKDNLSAPFCDGRQTGYKDSKVLPKIYTPAAVINGNRAVRGNDADSLSEGLRGAGADVIQPVRLNLRGNYLTITLPDLPQGEAADVWLFAYDYGYAVKHLTKLLRWDGRSAEMAFPVTDMPAAGYAVIAQRTNQTRIVAAGKTH